MSMGGDGSSMATSLQLEEARRRLEDETKRWVYWNPRYFIWSSNVFIIFNIPRSRSRYAAPLPPPPMMMMNMSADECTTVVFTFCDEQFPYRTKIPGKKPTLKQFKDYLPKKGSFRYVVALYSYKICLNTGVTNVNPIPGSSLRHCARTWTIQWSRRRLRTTMTFCHCTRARSWPWLSQPNRSI